MTQTELKQEFLANAYPSNKPQPAKQLGTVMKRPAVQFVLFGLILIAFQGLLSAGVLPSSFVFAIGNTVIYAIMAIGFCLLLGYSGLASLGTAGFIGIGTYVAFYVIGESGLPFIVAFVLTVALALIIGIMVGFISLRIEGIYLAIMTLGLSEILRNTFISLKATIKISMKDIRLFGTPVREDAIYILIVVVFVALLWITSNLINSPVGRALLAIKNSTSAAQAMGISLMKYRVLAFVLSTVYAAIAGLLYMMYIRNMTTSSSSLLTLATSLNILGAVVIGGAKSLWGTTFGVFIIYGLQSMFLSKIPFFVEHPAFITMLTGLLIILIVMFYPGGITQMVLTLRMKWRMKRAQKGGRVA